MIYWNSRKFTYLEIIVPSRILDCQSQMELQIAPIDWDRFAFPASSGDIWRHFCCVTGRPRKQRLGCFSAHRSVWRSSCNRTQQCWRWKIGHPGQPFLFTARRRLWSFVGLTVRCLPQWLDSGFRILIYLYSGLSLAPSFPPFSTLILNLHSGYTQCLLWIYHQEYLSKQDKHKSSSPCVQHGGKANISQMI